MTVRRRASAWMVAVVGVSLGLVATSTLLVGDEPKRADVRGESPRAETGPTKSSAAKPNDAARAEALERIWNEARRLREAGEYGQALEAGLAALKSAVAGFPPESEHLRDIRQWLADVGVQAEAWDESEKQLREIVEWSRRYRGDDHGETIDARLTVEHLRKLRALSPADREELTRTGRTVQEIVSLHEQGRYAEARDKARAALPIYRRILGERHPHYAAALYNLASLELAMGEYAQAESHFNEGLALRKELYGERHPHYATSLNNVAVLYEQLGQFTRAADLYAKVLAVRKVALGERHPDYATSLFNLAASNQRQGDTARAEALYRESLAVRKEVLGEKHPDYGWSLNNLGSVYYGLGDYARAERYFREAHGIWKEALGERHPTYATSLGNLAAVYQDMGDFARAEPLYVESRNIRKETLGERHPDYGMALNNLATLYESMGDDSRAEPLFLETRAIWKESYGERHFAYALALNNLAHLYARRHDHVRAEPLLVEALAIRKAVWGDRHPDYAESLGNLSLSYFDNEDYARAEPPAAEVCTIFKETLGDRHPRYALGLCNWASTLHNLGEYARAEGLFVEAIALRRATIGERHPDYADSLNSLALCYRCRGDDAKAEPLYRQAVGQALDHWELAAVVQSERQQRAMGERLRYHLDSFVSLTVDARLGAREAYAAVLRWKGAVLARQRTERRLRAQGDPAVRKLADELQATTRTLAGLALETPPPDRQADRLTQLVRLTEEKERLEAGLSAESAEFRRVLGERRLTPEELGRSLPVGAVLVDLLEYWHTTPPAAKKGTMRFERRVAAFVMSRERPAVIVDLGSAERIAERVDGWRKSLGADAAAQEAGRELRRQVWDPLGKQIGTAQTVFVSPDGALARFPWGALPGAKPEAFLLEETTLVVMPVPQLLPGLLEGRGEIVTKGGDRKSAEPKAGEPKLPDANGPSLLAVGDVDFGGGGATVPPAEMFAEVRASAARAGGAEIGFPPLPGAAREAAVIQRHFAEAFGGSSTRLLRADEASEAEFRAAAPKYLYLHVATHGYFAPSTIRSAAAADGESRGFQTRLAGAREAAGYHPGLLSGLALAGANRKPEPGRDDGILTALEAAELELDGVELVTLSACETGLGATAGGEGVLGLQRAFQTAGARNVVSSLWKVDDEATAALMGLFYENLWVKKLPAAEALRAAQLTILRNPGEIRGYAARGLGEVKTLPGGARVDGGGPEGPGQSVRTDVRRWAAFQISGAGR